jgi:hypothetical protein
MLKVTEWQGKHVPLVANNRDKSTKRCQCKGSQCKFVEITSFGKATAHGQIAYQGKENKLGQKRASSLHPSVVFA